MTTRKAALFPAAMALLLSACASVNDDRYPSLAVRDVERISGSADPVEADRPPPPPVEPDADLARRLRQLRQQAEAAHRAFLASLPSARAAVAAGSGAQVGGDGWAVAQAALSALNTARNPASLALAELDSLYVEAEIEVGAVEAIAAERDAVLSLVRDEEATLDQLQARLAV